MNFRSNVMRDRLRGAIWVVSCAALLPIFVSASQAQEADANAANALARAGNCFHCHAVDKAKKAPSFVKISQKYAGNPEALMILERHLTAGEAVKVEGADEKHASPPFKTKEELQNLIRWILTRA